MAHTRHTDAQILRDACVEKGWGERGYTLYERTTIPPALTVNGIVGGVSRCGRQSDHSRQRRGEAQLSYWLTVPGFTTAAAADDPAQLFKPMQKFLVARQSESTTQRFFTLQHRSGYGGKGWQTFSPGHWRQ